MDLLTLSQIAAPILQTIFIAVIGLGYFYTIRATVGEMRAEHAAGGGRPLITVSEDYANLPNISLIVQNVGQGPAKDISFEFSDRVQSSDGFVLSELPFFAEGLPSLAPGAKIGCYWDTLDNLLPLIKEGKIASEIAVTVRYKDLNLNPLQHNWEVNPRLYEGIRNVDYRGVAQWLVDLSRNPQTVQKHRELSRHGSRAEIPRAVNRRGVQAGRIHARVLDPSSIRLV